MKRQSLSSIRILVTAAAALAPLAGAQAASEGLDWKSLADRPAGPQGPVREEQDPHGHSEGLDWNKLAADTPAGAQGPVREVENPQEEAARADEEKFWHQVWPFGRKDMP